MQIELFELGDEIEWIPWYTLCVVARNLLLAALISESMAGRKRGGPNSITLMERLFIIRRYSWMEIYDGQSRN